MIDIHSHILPALDDGAATMSEALAMAEIAVNDGITQMIATPHTQDGRYINGRVRILKATAQLQKQLEQANIPLKLHAGAEIHLHADFLKNIGCEKVMSLADRGFTLLIELPHYVLPVFTEHVVHELLVSGYTPIIAHPERNNIIRRKPELLHKWVQQGALAQLTAGSLLGDWGKLTRKISLEMLGQHVVQLIASDAHNAFGRPPRLRKAYEVIRHRCSAKTADILRYNAEAILEGTGSDAISPSITRRGGNIPSCR